ncbi:MAG: efflux RND transporter periplasmic adaptor subunit [bacterium]|nr:efflux RND transporter periplasmic adaptor subunit [bacterium]
MKTKKFSKRIIIILIILAIGAIVFSVFFFRNGKEDLNIKKVLRGTVLKEISETGAVKVSERINISFKNSGRIESILVKVGDAVEPGQEIAKIDSRQLNIELAEAKANLDVAVADYDRLLAGYSIQEIQVVKTQLLNAEVSLRNSRQALADAELEAQDDLKEAHGDAIDDLEDSKLKAYNALNAVDDIRTTYFSVNDQEGFVVNSSKENIEADFNKISSSVSALNHSDFPAVGNSLSLIKSALSDISNNLETVRNMTETPKYKNTVPDTSKTSLDNQKSYIATAKSNVANAQQTISTVKINNGKSINTAEATVALAESNVDIAKDQLLLKEADPTDENINLYLAKVNQARANYQILQDRVGEAMLKSPVVGQIIEINKKAGETVQPSDYVAAILPSGPFEVEVNIYEEDIVEVKEGNPVKIEIPAFPDRVFNGRVVMIDPAEKIVDGVVYYKVVIGFEDTAEGMKPGMTADVAIQTQNKEDVLVVPREALKRDGGNYYVNKYENGAVKKTKIQIGVIGEENAEVISGLQEGAQIVIN